MDRHNTPTHLLEIIYCSSIADYYLEVLHFCRSEHFVGEAINVCLRV